MQMPPVKHFGPMADYPSVDQSMHLRVEQLANQASGYTGEIWTVDYAPVITVGRLTGADEVHTREIPVVKTDRGGKATYHGPGQFVGYPLIPIAAHGLQVRQWVCTLLHISGAVLQDFGIEHRIDENAIGVYTARGKIASLGIRIRKGISLHGISINVDLQPNGFAHIDPCGVKNGPVDQISNYCEVSPAKVRERWLHHLEAELYA